jgi:hypothetical protein
MHQTLPDSVKDTLKCLVGWCGYGVSRAEPTSAIVPRVIDWQQMSGMVLTLYTLLLIIGWFWRNGLRAWAERRGWVLPKKRRIVEVDADDLTGPGDLR